MKSAEIYSEPTANSNGYVWRWRGQGVTSQCFNFYYECLDDARRNGYQVELERPRGDTAPNSGAGSSMK